MEYPMELTIHGPYYKDDYDRLRDSFWLERAIDIKEANVFYILELLNTSTDTISIAVSKDIGNVCCHYLCFHTFEECNCLVQGKSSLGEYDLIEWDPLLPKETKRYFFYTWRKYDMFNKCELINLSLDVKSEFFDSLNLENPVRYIWYGNTPVELRHPVFHFTIVDEHFIPAAPKNIQQELNKSRKKLNIER